jgi:GT2 family glycosyltransferase
MNSKKIGLGIITCNRPEYLKNLVTSLVTCIDDIDELVVINDGTSITNFNLFKGELLENETNLGVAKSKNKALKYLLSKNCDYYFLIEDDMKIINPLVFQTYIDLCNISGIQHFNYGPGSPFNRKQSIQNFDLHNRHLLEEKTEPNPKLIVDYKSCKLALYEHVTGTFSFYTKKILDIVGVIDEQFFNAWDHVDHTYSIIKAGYHPPFWWFADIHDSHKFIEPQQSAIKNSSTSKNTESWLNNVRENAERYKQKNGHYPAEARHTSQQDVISYLKKLKK